LVANLSEGTERTTIASLSLSLICGYSREGTFATRDEGDTTVGFALVGADKAVFYEKRLLLRRIRRMVLEVSHGFG
jgi:hypothetical protein